MFSKPQKVKRIVADLQNTINFFMIPHNLRKRSQLEQLLQVIKQVPFFQKYVENGWEKVCQQCLELMTYESFEADQEIFAQGTIGESFYVILEGQVGVYVNIVGNLEDNKIIPTNPNISQDGIDQPKEPNDNPEGAEQAAVQEPPKLQKCVKVLESGDSFGELSLIYNRPRLASIKALQTTHLAVLNKKDFRSILRDKEESQLIKEMQYFTTLPIFEGQNFNLVRDIYLNTFKIKVTNNEIIFNEGDISDAVYIIKSGEFAAFKQFCHEENEQHKMNQGIIQPEMNIFHRNANKQDKKFKQMTLTMLGNKELFGEENLLMSENRQFGVKCQSVSGELLMIKRDQFLNKVMSDTHTSKHIKERCQKKLQNMKRRIENIEGQLYAYSSYLVGDDRKIKLRRNMESMTNIDNYYFQKSRENSLDQDDHPSAQHLTQNKVLNTNNNVLKNRINGMNPKQQIQILSPEASITQLPNMSNGAQQSHRQSEGQIPIFNNTQLKYENGIEDHQQANETNAKVMKQDQIMHQNRNDKSNILKQISQSKEQKNQYIKLNNPSIQSSSNTAPVLPTARSQYSSEQNQTHYDPHCDPLRDQLQIKMNVLMQHQKNMKIFKIEETVYNGQYSHEELSEKLKNMRDPTRKYVDYLKGNKETNGSQVDAKSSHIKNLISKMQKRKNDDDGQTFKLDLEQVKFLSQVHGQQNLPNGQTNDSKSIVKQIINQTESLWPSSTNSIQSKQISRVESAYIDSPIKLEANKISSKNSEKKSILKNSRPQSSHISFNQNQKLSPVKNSNPDSAVRTNTQNIQFSICNNVDTNHSNAIIHIRPLSGRATFAKSMNHLDHFEQESYENLSTPTSPSCLGSQRADTSDYFTNGKQLKKQLFSQQSLTIQSPLKQKRISSAKCISTQFLQKTPSTIQCSHSKTQSSSQLQFEKYFTGMESISKGQSEIEQIGAFAPIVPLSTQQKMYQLQQSLKKQLNPFQDIPQKQLVSNHLSFKPKMQKRSQTSKGYRNPLLQTHSISSQNSSKGNIIQKSEKVSQTQKQNESHGPLFRPFSAKDKSCTLQGPTQFFKNINSGDNMRFKSKQYQVPLQSQAIQKQIPETIHLPRHPSTGNLYSQNETLIISSNNLIKQTLK